MRDYAFTELRENLDSKGSFQVLIILVIIILMTIVLSSLWEKMVDQSLFKVAYTPIHSQWDGIVVIDLLSYRTYLPVNPWYKTTGKVHDDNRWRSDCSYGDTKLYAMKKQQTEMLYVYLSTVKQYISIV